MPPASIPRLEPNERKLRPPSVSVSRIFMPCFAVWRTGRGIPPEMKTASRKSRLAEPLTKELRSNYLEDSYLQPHGGYPKNFVPNQQQTSTLNPTTHSQRKVFAKFNQAVITA